MRQTKLLSNYFIADGFYGKPDNKDCEPNSIEDIFGFREVVWR
ncbi:hypothetical protein PLUA15_410004 [Pseudomonas lundensis]|uniref:Transposase n=1 Tax=Pseudomonas lundensis TaxID=86185 RepID=A0AAX2HBI0_9PSED|nr:hypothetical protein PLUA15_410004 [Pseudomonas lundensis]